MSKKRVLFIASTGGHLNELLQLKSMFSDFDYCLVTEKTKSNLYLKEEYGKKVHFLVYGTKYHFLSYPFKFFINCVKSLFLYLKYRPDYIITTGVHTSVPMCYLGKVFGSRIIYIETFANMVTKTVSGKIVYAISDLFVVQWESMKKLYPDSVFGGWIY